MNITSAKYLTDPIADNQNICIEIEVDGDSIAVPLDPANRHYAEICKQVEAGTLVIQEADGGSE